MSNVHRTIKVGVKCSSSRQGRCLSNVHRSIKVVLAVIGGMLIKILVK